MKIYYFLFFVSVELKKCPIASNIMAIEMEAIRTPTISLFLNYFLVNYINVKLFAAF